MFYTLLNDVHRKENIMNIAKKIAQSILLIIPAVAATMTMSWASDKMVDVWTD